MAKFGRVRSTLPKAFDTVMGQRHAERWGRARQERSATILVDNAGHLCAADADACRRQSDLHRLWAGFRKLAGDEPERPLGDLRRHRAGLRGGIVDEFVDCQLRTTAKREDGLVKSMICIRPPDVTSIVTKEYLAAG